MGRWLRAGSERPRVPARRDGKPQLLGHHGRREHQRVGELDDDDEHDRRAAGSGRKEPDSDRWCLQRAPRRGAERHEEGKPTMTTAAAHSLPITRPAPLRRAALIFNPVAGRGADDLDALREGLEARFDLTVLATCRERDADACARDALAKAPDLLIAAGGDGTVSMVAGALVGSPTPLGIIARGTSNSIATGLGIPTDLEGALETLATGDVCAVDTARANGQPMILHASVGFHAATVAGTPRDAKHRWGVLAYIKEGLVALGDLEQFQVEIETENAIVHCRAVNVTIANVAPRKTVLAQGPATVSPDDGALDVTIVAATGLAEVVATGLHLLRTASRGEPATRDNVGYLSARRLRIDTDPAQPLLVDGEPAGRGRLVLECLPRSLHVILPSARDLPRPPPSDTDVAKLEGLPDLEVEPKVSAASSGSR